MLSVSVAVFSVILVGRVICGMKLLDGIFFKKLIYSCVWYIFKMRFRLKLPLILEDLFSNVSFSIRMFMKSLLNL